MSSSDGDGAAEGMVVNVRVRYAECDPQGVVHHSVFPVWFEMARTELLRSRGLAYRELEEEGAFFVVAKLNVRYRRPARYDDDLRIHVELKRAGGCLVEHAYRVYRGDERLCDAEILLVCVDGEGKRRDLPAGVFPGA